MIQSQMAPYQGPRLAYPQLSAPPLGRVPLGGGSDNMPSGLSIVAFYVIAIVLVGSALAVVLMRNIVHAALFLAAFFGAAAGIYVLLNAEFIAIVQVLIYAGAVTILVLFAIMLTRNAMSTNANPFAGQWWLAGIICIV